MTQETEGKSVSIIMGANELEELIRTSLVSAAMEGAALAMARLEEKTLEEKAIARKRKLHNTRLLLRNYQVMKENCTESVYSKAMARNTDMEYFDQLMRGKEDREDLIIASIKESAERTAVILAHVDKMLAVFKGYCTRSGSMETRRYEVLKRTYLLKTKKKAKDLALDFDVTERTIFKDLEIAEERLSVLFFGVDGLKF